MLGGGDGGARGGGGDSGGDGNSCCGDVKDSFYIDYNKFQAPTSI